MYAVIETGGKQYRVQEGDVLTVEKLNVEAGDQIEFDKVLVLSNDDDMDKKAETRAFMDKIEAVIGKSIDSLFKKG